jgi:hypothetical protein
MRERYIYMSQGPGPPHPPPEVAFPFKGALETYTTPADKKWLLHSLFTLRGLLLVLSHAECA